ARSRLFAATLADIGATHKPIKPRCPWTNGKAERFNRTLAVEWAYATAYDYSADRVAALPAWLHDYNHHRPHTAHGGHPPAHRVNNLCSGDSLLLITAAGTSAFALAREIASRSYSACTSSTANDVNGMPSATSASLKAFAAGWESGSSTSSTPSG